MKSKYKKVDWSKVAVDTPIWVRQEPSVWVTRHFARFYNNVVLAWSNGGTSHTAPHKEFGMPWKYASLTKPGGKR